MFSESEKKTSYNILIALQMRTEEIKRKKVNIWEKLPLVSFLHG